MTVIHFDRKLDDDSRRERLYDGDVFVYSANEHSMALVDLARKLIAEAFPGIDPRTAQYRYDVKEFAAILAKLKPAFIHHPECKKIIPRMLAAIGCDLDQTHFDIPRMRTSTFGGSEGDALIVLPVWSIIAGRSIVQEPQHKPDVQARGSSSARRSLACASGL